MGDVSKRLSELSPEKRALLMKKLQEKSQQQAKKFAIPKRENQQEYPMSFAQERMWFLYQWDPSSPSYNISAAARCQGKLNVKILQQCLNEIIRRHEVLRAAFVTEDERPKQMVLPELSLDIPLIDLSHLLKSEQEARSIQLATEDAQTPFDISRPPLLRASLLRLGPEEHIVLFTMHHIISDGWSIGVLIRELMTLYHAFSAGKPSPLDELSIQYADFAVWQKSWLQGELLDNQIAYWKKQLAGSPPILDLPTDRPRPAYVTYRGAHQAFTFSRELLDGLKALSKEMNVTLFTTLLAAFNVLLYRYSRQEDISVGTPIANRTRAELEDLIGFFVNTLVMRSDLSGNPSFRELVKRVNDMAMEAYAHQDVPFEMLVSELHPERDMSHTPFFQVMFALQDARQEALQTPELKISLIETESGTAKFDMILFAEERKDGLRIALEYNVDLFNHDTISRMAGHFHTLLRGIVHQPDQSIDHLPLMTPKEERTVVLDWNQTRRDYPRDCCVNQLFEAQVDRTPDATAVIFGEKQISYRELNERANQLAHYLQKLGVQPDDFVAIIMERSLDMIVATLGILKAGAVYVPLDTAYPKPRMAFMLEDTQVPVILTQKQLKNNLPDYQAHVIVMDEEWERIALESISNPIIERSAKSIAYVMYTSGSTGRPKGVAVPHQAINRLVLNTDYVTIEPTDRIAQAANASFDAATFEIWGALLTGATLVGITKDVVLSTYEFVKELREKGISILFLTTALFNQIANEIPDAFRTLKQVSFGGEACDPNSVRKVVRAAPPKELLNVYGPTENTTFSTWYLIKDVPEGAHTIPIGRAIANSTIYVLDKNLRPVPVGVPGELYCGGDGLAQQYYNRPDLTAEKFIPDPFSHEPGARLYRTGDLVKWLPDGNIEFMGRIDQQVKIRGFRIELGEIESLLRNHPGLQDAAVIAREDQPGVKRLVAYVVPDEDHPATNAELRSYLLEKLPEYMVPGIFMRMEALPINPNGKLDRKALPVPDQSRPELERAYVTPRTKFEAALAKMWQEILGIEQVGIYDNFFELGGNSLQAAVFVNKLQKAFGEAVHVRSIFLAPTIAEFSTYATEYYHDKIQAHFGEKIEGPTVLEELSTRIEKVGRIDASHIAQFRKIIQPLPARPHGLAPQKKNPTAIFVLSPPRSGSTLFRVMLAGHPQLFAPPELDLLSFNTLRERKKAFEQELTIWLEAAWRAIMEIKSCDLAEAQRIMADCEERNLSTKEFYALLQQWIGDKILVDKTPSYPLDIEILKRAEEDFEDAKYIHLVRHPYATIYSFLEAKLDKNFFRYENPFTRRELAELIWLVCHQNILTFLKDIPAERQYRLKFEDLVRDPETYVKEICQFLNVDFNVNMLKPYHGKRMTDGVTEKSQMVGDFKFYLHKKIDDNAADRWKKIHSEDFLSDFSWKLAEQLGYERMEQTAGDDFQSRAKREALTVIRPIPRTGNLPLSYQQQRLWFLDQMAPGSSSYNIPVAVRISGQLNIEATVKSLNEIIRRHEVLRTRFFTIDGKPVPIVSPDLTIDMPIKDLSGLSEQQRETVAQQEAVEEARLPFDLAKDALIRGRILKLGSESFVLLLTMHHIVSDGWSAGVIIQEFAALYQAFIEGKPSPLPELPIQYIDYAAWQREWLKGEVLQLQLDYWRQQLEGCPPVLELPTDRPRPAEITYNGASARLTIPVDLTQEIKGLCRREGVTEFMVLLAAFQTLLYRYSGQTDICVGTPIANRGRAEIENLIGFFVNTLVLRTKFADHPSFRELLKRVQKTSLGAYAHQELPFEMLVDAIQPERSMSHTPLFQVMFAFQNTPVQDLQLPGLIISPFQTKSVTSKFDLTLSVREFEGEFRGLLEYNTDLFNEDTIKRMVRHLKTLLKNAVQNPDLGVDRLPLLEFDERQQLIIDWNRTEKEYPTDRCIHQLFEARAAETPEALAVVYGDNQLTYRELNARANQLAHLLRKKGVGPDTLVGLCVERSVEMIVGILGIMKAGGAYAALDPSYPAERIQFILEDSQISILLTLAHLKMPALESKVEQICLDTDWPMIARQSQKNPKNLTDPENLAYLIYTSGSTGRPKGVMMPHRGAINLWSGLNQAIYANHPTDRPLKVSLNAPLLFDASVQQLVQLLSGHTIDIVPQEARQDGEALLKYLQQSKVDVLDCVPSQLKLLLEAGLLNGNSWTPSIVLPGGEAIDEATWQALQRADGMEFYNMYGPTECAVDSTIARIKTSDGRPVIGRPINNAVLYVLDANLEIVPIGVHGELYIAGEGLARGYLHRPDLTAERFLPDPFSIIPGSRMYRTGDLVRYLPDGNLEFLGRIDHQVKVRGFRIELGEIEFALEQHPEVKQAVVMVREDEPGVKRLVGYIVPNAMPGPNPSDLKNFLKAKLPEYMIPAVFMNLEALPLTPNAKIDRKALPKPEITRSDLEAAFVAPRNEAEEKLAAIWKQLLGIDRVGVNDNFFELGGDSILTIQVIAKAKQAGLQLTPKQLFQYPTIAGLAAVAKTARVILAEQGLVTGEIPLTPIQHAFFEQNLPEPHHWNQSLLLEIRQEMHLDWLKEAIRHLLNHHDALRLRFERAEDGWKQINAGELAEVPFEYFDFSMIKETELKSTIEARANELQASLDLASGRIVTFAYFDLGQSRTGRLLIVIHHTAIDGVSWRILLEDLYTAYSQLSQGQKVQLPAKTTSFQQWSHRLTEYAQSEVLEKELAYWDKLSDQPISALPVDFPGGSNLEADADLVEVALSPEETRVLLKDVPGAFGTSINDVLLTAVASAFAQWTGENHLLVDLEGHGREDLFDDVDLSRTVGWFTSLYPVVLRLPKGRPLSDRLKAIKEQLHRIPNHGIGYGLLRYLHPNAAVRERLHSQQHPEVAFNYLGQFDQLADATSPFAPAPESSGNERSLTSPRSHKIIINSSVTGERLKVTWNFSRALHRVATIERLAEGFVETLQNILALSRSSEGIGYTPSDFTDVALEQEELEELVAELEEA